MLIDEVCWFFPELKFVMRHGAEPWADLAAKLLLKWPNLYYSTSAFAPAATTRRPSSTSPTPAAPTRSCTPATSPWASASTASSSEMPDVPFKDEVWPKFLRENAMRVFKLD